MAALRIPEFEIIFLTTNVTRPVGKIAKTDLCLLFFTIMALPFELPGCGFS